MNITHQPITIATPLRIDDMPRSDNVDSLCFGTAVTTCCGAFATFHDETLCCKKCWRALD